MLTRISLTLVFISCSSLVCAQDLTKIETPQGTQPSGLTHYDGHFYMSSYKLKPGIYKIKASDGEVVAKITPDIVWDDRYGGLAASQQGLVHVQANNNKGQLFSLISFDNGRPVGNMRLNVPQDSSDLAIHKSTMWVISAKNTSTDPQPARLYVVDLNQSRIMGSFVPPIPEKKNGSNYGMAFGDDHLFVSSDSTVVKVDPKTMKVVETYKMKEPRIESLAWDGKDLWAASFDGGIYKVQR